MTKQRIAKFFILTAGILATPALSMAGTEMKESKEVKVVEAAKENWISGDIGVDFVSQYVSRGSILENQGVIAQPSLNLYFKLYEGEGFINNVTLYLQLWSSIHSENTDAGLVTGTPGHSSTPAWYEFDYYPGFNITFAKNFTLSLGYAEFNYPNDGFFTQRLIQTKLAYNDADLLGAFALNPYVAYEYYLETPDEASYFEVGVSPGFSAGPLKVSFPIKAGFGADHFYTDANGTNESFGYVAGGVALSYPLAFVPEKFGTWTVSAGYTYYHLGDALQDFNTAERGGSVRDANENEHVFSGGVRLAF